MNCRIGIRSDGRESSSGSSNGAGNGSSGNGGGGGHRGVLCGVIREDCVARFLGFFNERMSKSTAESVSNTTLAEDSKHQKEEQEKKKKRKNKRGR